MISRKGLVVILFVFVWANVVAQESFKGRKFEQLDDLLPTPNSFRSADGSPGYEYWQQKVDYKMKVELDDENQHLTGSETITYHNNSKQPLSYLWLQLEQNIRSKTSDTYSSATSSMDNLSKTDIVNLLAGNEKYGFNLEEVKDNKGNPLKYTVNKTMMRVDLPEQIPPGGTFDFYVKWNYYINDRSFDRARSGMEYFEEDGNYIYTIAQFFPRLAVYNDVEGWQNKQFLGRGEFTLPFGDYHVEITVPSDHVVGSTGTLQNPKEVLSSGQIELLAKARVSSKPVVIISQDDAAKNEKSRSADTKTWIYNAENVRDFAWTSSRKFIWDAMGVNINGKTVMAMSYYPKEANPLYGEYSTNVVAHTLKFYSSYLFDYPYPKAISVEANNGMEYPMIAFNYGRPDKDGNYTNAIKHGMISVIIHEVGHNFFPMIVNSDERQWTWMDEGLNSFVQFLAEKAWDPNYPSRRGPPENIVPYMKGSHDFMKPIMTNSEQILQFSNNAYGKPATALNILRETVMGPELFDYSFKTYANRWKFKHPTPADFFRTMEDASAVDLDWFWRGWFYTTDKVDIDLEDVTWYKFEQSIETESRSRPHNKKKSEESDEEGDQVSKLDQYQPANFTLGDYGQLMDSDNNFYQLKLRNKGGLVMPVIVKINYKDGTSEIEKFPAEIWRKKEEEVTKIIIRKKEIESFEIDPERQTADVDISNNYFPRKEIKSRFELYKSGG